MQPTAPGYGTPQARQAVQDTLAAHDAAMNKASDDFDKAMRGDDAPPANNAPPPNGQPNQPNNSSNPLSPGSSAAPINPGATPAALPNSGAAAAAANGPHTIVYVQTAIPDPALGMDTALTGMIPRGWENRMQVSWCSSPYNPVSLAGSFDDPRTGMAFYNYPRPAFLEQTGRQLFANGANYMGSIVEPVASPDEYIAKVIIPQYRPELANAQSDPSVETPMAEKQELLRCRVRPMSKPMASLAALSLRRQRPAL